MNYFIFMILLCTQIGANATTPETGSFSLTPWALQPSTEAEIDEGIQRLFKNSSNCVNVTESCPSDIITKQIREEALHFQELIRSKVTSDQNIQYSVNEKKVAGGFVIQKKFTFPSLIQRGDHPADTVVVNLFQSVGDPNCKSKKPAILLLHHIEDDIDTINDLAKFMAIKAGLIGNGIVAAVIHLPHYGQRKKSGENFLVSDLAQFKLNLAQAVLDIRLTLDLLKSNPDVESSAITLGGISLGGVLGLTAGAFNTEFTGGYQFLVGGGDFANILMNRVRTRPGSEVDLALEGARLTEEELRIQLAPVDPIVWAHRYNNTRVMAISAKRDDIVNYENSVLKLKDIFTQPNANLQFTERLNDDTHSPSGSPLDKLKNVLLPFVKFADQALKKRPIAHCEPADFGG